MTELRFHRSVYAAAAVDEALKIFEKYGRFEQAEEADHRVVRLEASSPGRERRVAGELANYALGLTIRSRNAAA